MDEILEPHLINRSWLDEPSLKAVLATLNTEEYETRIVGGAVRNALLGEEIGDLDLATTASPEIVAQLSESAGFKVIPTGLDHGTVTVVVEGMSFEVTTLRNDVKTDGRHAVVSYTTDWQADAERRDFTMNALFIDKDGNIHDPLGGYADLVHRNVRFIGDPEKRIREDYLRILRFFRFFAYYGAGRPDRDGLRAIVRTKSELKTLSVERVWSELKKILGAPNPERSLLWMRTTEVLEEVLPENWGLDQFHWLLNAEREHDWKADAMLRLEAMLRPDADIIKTLSNRLKLSNAETTRLHGWASESYLASGYVDLSVVDFAKVLYRNNPKAIQDALSHEFAKRLNKDEPGGDRLRALKDFIETWDRPKFPISGQDLKERGFREGRILGNKLIELEDEWVESGFALTRAAILDNL